MASTDLADTIEQARNSIAASLDSMRSERVRSDFSSSFLARGAAESAASADDWMRSCDERLAAMQKKIETACRDGASASRLSAIEQQLANLHDSSRAELARLEGTLAAESAKSASSHASVLNALQWHATAEKRLAGLHARLGAVDAGASERLERVETAMLRATHALRAPEESVARHAATLRELQARVAALSEGEQRAAEELAHAERRAADQQAALSRRVEASEAEVARAVGALEARAAELEQRRALAEQRRADDAAELTRCKGAMAEVLGFQQRTRTELAEATHAAAAALARASRAEGLAAEANAVTTTHASQTRERLGDLEGRFTALAAAQLHAGEALDVVVDALGRNRLLSDAQSDRIRRSQERQRACLALAGATPPDDAPPAAVVASTELPRRPVSPQSAAHYLRRADAAKPAARKWTP